MKKSKRHIDIRCNIRKCRCNVDGECLSGDAYLAAAGRMMPLATPCPRAPDAVYEVVMHFSPRSYTEVIKKCDPLTPEQYDRYMRKELQETER